MKSTEPTRLQRYLKRYPEDVRALHLLYKWYRKQGHLDEAYGALRRALDADPTDVWTHLYIGNMAYVERDWDTALVWFEFAAMLDPDITPPIWSQADVYEFQDRQDLAELYFRKAMELDPDDEQSARLYLNWRLRRLVEQAHQHRAEGRHEAAGACIREIQELAPDCDWTRHFLEEWHGLPEGSDDHPSDANSGA